MNDEPTITLPPSRDPVASIVISVSAGIGLLLECLASLAALGPDEGVPFEAIVVLNEVLTEDEARLRASVSGFRIVVSPVNLGLAGAGNRGRAEARGAFVVLLHDDARVRPGWLANLVRAAHANPEAAIVGSRILSPDLTLQGAGSILWQDASTSPAWVGAVPEPGAFDRPRQVDYCGTVSLLVRAGFWDAIGGLDEQFYPAYYVDVDLCTMARESGWAVLYEPRSEVIHHRSASTGAEFRRFIASRNAVLFAAKWRAALDRQEAFLPDDPSGSHERALGRATDRRHVGVPFDSAKTAPLLDVAAQQLRHVDRARLLREAFEGHLLGRLAVREEVRTSIPPYALGTLLSFGEGGHGHDYLVQGEGNGSEHWGAWASAPRVRVLLPLESPPGGGGASLTLVACHLIGVGRSASTLSLAVNGQVLLSVKETRGGSRSYDILLPTGLHTVADCLLIEIEAPEPMTPEALGINQDTRRISIGLVSLRVAAT